MTRANAIPRWDWYGASVAESDGEKVVHAVGQDLRLVHLDDKGRHGYGHRARFMAGKRCVASVSWGGTQPHAFIEGTGSDAPQVADLIRRRWPEHRVARVDSAMDWDDLGAWERIAGAGLEVAKLLGIKTYVAGDWLSDGHEDGRTLYIGGRTSPVRARIYEKGKQRENLAHERPNWTRAELVVRGQKGGKTALASVEPLEVWGASRWSESLAERLLAAPVAPLRLTEYTRPDDERARRFMLDQYGPTMYRWAQEYGGDWATFGLMLGDEIMGTH